MSRSKVRWPWVVAAMALVAGLSFGSASGSLHQAAVVSDEPAANTPDLAATTGVPHPLALAVGHVGQTIVVGGRFQAVEDSTRTQTYPRRDVVAFDSSTGAVDANFAPRPNGPVFAVLGTEHAVYVGGEFTKVNGVRRPGLVKLNPDTGAVVRAFKPFALRGGRVSEIALVRHRLIVSGTFSRRLLALNPTTGRDTRYIDAAITGQLRLSTSKTEVAKFAVNPQGTRLVAVGNFTAVNGHDRKRAFMLTLGKSQSVLNTWYYPPLEHKCKSHSPTYQASLEDVDFSPNGSYFVFAATGYVPARKSQIGTAVCDAAARFETYIQRPTKPTWINYTGGDSLHAVSVTGAAVYVQGHNRWLDNPYGKDFAGPGAVPRLGIGAIDPRTGLALSWNPRKPAEQGGHDFLTTPQGLWVVSDSTMFDQQYHRGIAFCPLP